MITKRCPECGSNSWQNPDGTEDHPQDIHRICDDCGQEYYTDVDYGKPLEARGTSENSGGSSSYYILNIECPHHLEPYTVECGDVIDALGMNPQELNIFKEVWRTAAARQGKEKKGNSPIRAAEKIKFYADRNLQLIKFKEG